ncbi:MFS general substrate transporter [Wilcoxina mikolae CBS 423.85]|nr:MFS general substrate transporter [Wilcoxina mikolae CBS 423.85]
MGLGIIEPKSNHHVPGTSRLYDDRILHPGVEAAISQEPERLKNLKHGTGKEADILLVPQPSNSPNDPLNWPLWKRDLTLFVLCLTGAVVATIGPSTSPVTGILVKEFDTTFTEVAKWSGWQFWSSGLAGLIGSAFSRIWGKRSVYLLSTIICFAGVAWNIKVKTANSFLAARVLQGFGIGVFETMIPSSIGDLFFVHQRGKRVAFYNLCFLGSTFFMPVLGGYISVQHGWRTQYIIIASFLGPICVLVFFLVPEHMYNRPAIFDTDTSSHENLSELDSRLDTTPVEEEQKHTFVQQLRLFNGRFSSESFIRCIIAPFVLFMYPATIWAFLFQGTFITWGISVSIILAQVFSAPPYNYDAAQLGYMYGAPFIGALCSYFIAGVFSDSAAKYMAKWNNNIYEPEFRILLVIPVAIIALPGIYTFGVAAEAHTHWIVPSICYGLLTFGVVMMEMMVSLLLLKNFWAFGSTFFVNDWVVKRGPKEVFYVIGAIQTAVCGVSVAMYIGGKVQRDTMHRWNPLMRAGLYPKTLGPEKMGAVVG